LKEKIQKSEFVSQNIPLQSAPNSRRNLLSFQSHIYLLERLSDMAVKNGDRWQALY
jgi:hypothetical protein